jgi:hypothetical protein
MNKLIYSTLLIIFGFLVLVFLGNHYFSNEIEGFTATNNSSTSNTTTSNTTSNTSTPNTSTSNTNKNTLPNHKHFDNYNHFSKTIYPFSLTNGQLFNSSTGGSIKVTTNGDGSPSLLISKNKGEIPVLYSIQKPSSTSSKNFSHYNNEHINNPKFYGPNGSTATVIMGNNGQESIIVNSNNGTITYIQESSSSIKNTPYTPSYQGTYSPVNYPVTTNYPTTPNSQPNYNPINNNNQKHNPWMSSLPQGVPFDQIVPGEEDLYILKSEIVPPVCPVCNISQTQNQTCPPCKPCGRCELPPFECKKVPNYSALSDEFQPVPVLNDFSGFGM